MLHEFFLIFHQPLQYSAFLVSSSFCSHCWSKLKACRNSLYCVLHYYNSLLLGYPNMLCRQQIWRLFLTWTRWHTGGVHQNLWILRRLARPLDHWDPIQRIWFELGLWKTQKTCFTLKWTRNSYLWVTNVPNLHTGIQWQSTNLLIYAFNFTYIIATVQHAVYQMHKGFVIHCSTYCVLYLLFFTFSTNNQISVPPVQGAEQADILTILSSPVVAFSVQRNNVYQYRILRC